MPSCCVVLNCKNKYTHTKNVSFHKFPHHKLILMKWIEFTGREDWFPSRWSSICSRHFVPNDFRQHKSRKCLRPGAIPSVLPPNEDDGDHTKSNNINNILLENFNKDFTLKDIPNFTNSVDHFWEQQKSVYNVNASIKNLITNTDYRLNSEDSDYNVTFLTNISQNSEKETEKIIESTCNTEVKVNSTNYSNLNVSNCVISVQIICRLCGINNVLLESQLTLNNLEILNMIEKCFPSLNIQLNDNLSAEICEDCFNNLKEFSNFTDIVKRQQRNVRTEENHITRNEEKLRHHTKNTLNLEKNTPNIKIKQEPTIGGIKVKQEISELPSYLSINSSQLTNSENGDTEFEQQQNNETIDQKSTQFLKIPLINTEQVSNNCDVMEVISLDDAFIELLDDDVQIDNNQQPTHIQNNGNLRIPVVTKIENCDHNNVEKLPNSNLSIYNICEEHNYTRLNNYKQENIENDNTILNIANSMPSESQPKKSGIIVLNEDILKPAAPFDLYTCRDCGLPFFFEIHLNEHRRINHPESTYFCIICNSNFDKYIDLLKHRKICHKSTRKKSKKKLLTCPMCGKKFVSKVSLNNHRKYICEYQQKNRVFKCKYCAMKLDKWIILRKHEKKCRIASKNRHFITNEVQNSSPKIIQNIQTVFPTIYQRKATNIINQLPTSQFQDNIYTCKVCYRSYKNQQHLIRHSFVHDAIKDSILKCDNCYTIFDQLKDLQKHLRYCKRSKIGKSVFNCLECGKKYKFLQGLQEHKLKIHSKIKPEYNCTECKKIFNGIRNLKQHMQQHSNVRRKCPMCDKTFKQLSGLNQHKKSFHLNIKPHECPICKRKYALKADMRRCRHSDKRLRHLKGYLSNEDFDE